MTLGHFQTYDHYGYALIAVLGTLLAVMAVYWLMHRSPWVASVSSLRGIAPPFVNILGVLFGLTLAFLANDTWSSHDRAINAVYKEADALRSLLALASNLEAPLKREVEGALTDYASATVEEWPRLAGRAISQEVGAKGDALLRLVAGRAMAGVAGASVQSLMLQRVTDLRNERDLWIGLSQTHINPLKWLGMAFLGLLTLLSVAVIHVENPCAVLAAAPTAAIVLLQGNPFLQPFAVTPAPIIAVLDSHRFL